MRARTEARIRNLAWDAVKDAWENPVGGGPGPLRLAVDDHVKAAVETAVESAVEQAAVEPDEGLVSRWIDERLADDGEFRLRLLAEAAEVGERNAQRALERTKLDFLAFARARAEQMFQEAVPPVIEINTGHGPSVRLPETSHRVLPDVLLVLKARCHALLVGPAGTGKSMLAQQVATALGLEFHAISLGPTTPMSKIFGYYDAHGTYHPTPFRRAFEHGGVMLLDELDAGHPGLLSELNQALSLGVCAFADDMVDAHPDFRVIATANTYGTGPDRQYTGRQALDAATLDRFTIVEVPVDERLEERLTLAHAPSQPLAARAVLERVRRLRSAAERKRLPVMFSPRASIDSAKLLEAGARVEQVMEWRVLRGLSAAHRAALDPEETAGDGG
ncbi:AAA family ATPase [Streptomyces profundus]|uniref:AAA family ATPase n=1 Tax=Streptomyces profundus TaxID=2867410 RepID=UPI001D16A7EC|nr:AAA family ATPase [Streptomyces sp. MA3_2.13]UED86221.1 AAA family ATPase [Streptomyces sp. MA3_2.13]